MIQLQDLLEATGGQLLSPPNATCFTDFCFDSRRVETGQLFLAVRTDKGDGHDYVLDAIRGGATGVLCQEPSRVNCRHTTCIVVPDTEIALIDWARYILGKYQTEVIATTGSVGKTSTKEAVAAVLSSQFSVFRNRGSFNGLYGLPIALGRLAADHQLAVLELGSDHVGEIESLASLTNPRIGIVTAIGAAHLETLRSLDQVAKEKGSLVSALPESPAGLAILNWDDPRVRAMKDWARADVITAGLEPGADIQAIDVHVGLDGTSFAVNLENQRIEISIPWLGRLRIFAALAALAVGRAYDIPVPKIVTALANLPWLAGRLNALPAIDGATLIDDTFNSSPDAVLAALDFLDEIKVAGKKIAVLGDMYQLGDRSSHEHFRVGQRAAETVDQLIVKGELAADIGRGAEAAGLPAEQVLYTYSTDEVMRHLRRPNQKHPTGKGEQERPGDLILVKGSALTRLERVSQSLLAFPERDQEKLARQHPVFGQVVLSLPGRPTWVEIDVEATAYNTRRIRAMIGPAVKLLVVLKADAYGHGAIRLARVALNNGAECIGVASLNEAITLRDAGIIAPIIILGYLPAWSARQALLNGVTVTIFDLDTARAFNRAAAELERLATVHIKVDTGMGRLGLMPNQVLGFLRQLKALDRLEVEGMFTHFSVADSTDPHHRDHTDEQLERFRQTLAELEAADLCPPVIHCANSAAILTRPDTYFNMVRLGIALHGLDPSPAVHCPPDFRRALSFKTTIAQLKELPAGTPISYGNTYQTREQQLIAIIPVGYADGFRRAPAHWEEVLVRGQRAPIVGRVTMDQTMIDVSGIPGVRMGDEVVLIGRQGAQEITAEEVAKKLGTINYEVVAGILARVPRIS